MLLMVLGSCANSQEFVSPSIADDKQELSRPGTEVSTSNESNAAPPLQDGLHDSINADTAPTEALQNNNAFLYGEDLALNQFKSVLFDGGEYFSTDYKKTMDIEQQLTLPDKDSPMYISKFAVVDLDSDGMPEIILQVSISEQDVNEYDVLHFINGLVYGYSFTYREFQNLKTDGTFFVTDSANDYGFGLMSFTKSTSTVDRIASCETKFDTDDNGVDSYFINNKSVTEEEFLTVVTEQKNKTDAIWYDFTKENVENVLQLSTGK